MTTTLSPAMTIYGGLTAEDKAALACPYWCGEPAGHGITDDEIDRFGELIRVHLSREVVAVEKAHHSGRPVTVQLDYCVSHDGQGVDADPTVLHVYGEPDPGLTLDEAKALAQVITLVAESVR
ncbi:hypothetical protein GCM10009836_68820 [Pseudonocardia ailaonensis]|uniref:Uncharacterized protein n=1 Tax=Pseudonocardia ailaonensis TaxID=367279 RepID=A0ABN2NP67_9PSEU